MDTSLNKNALDITLDTRAISYIEMIILKISS